MARITRPTLLPTLLKYKAARALSTGTTPSVYSKSNPAFRQAFVPPSRFIKLR